MNKCTVCGQNCEAEQCFRHKPRKPLKRTRIKTNAVKLPHRSKKRIVQEREYNRKRRIFMEKNPVCQFENCNLPSTECHHAKGRIGDLLTDERYFVALCHEHHTWVELNPLEAKEKGLSLSRLAQTENNQTK